MAEKRVTLAVVAGAHGVGGEVRLKLFTESVESFEVFGRFDAAGRALTLKSLRETGKQPIARFAEIADRNGAEALRGTELTVPRSALPALEEGEYYHIDLIGLPCVTKKGDRIGEVVAVENFGAGDIIEIERSDGSDFMVPLAEPAAVLDDGCLVISPDYHETDRQKR